MKKIICIILCILCIGGCSNKASTDIIKDQVVGLQEINYEELKEKLEKKEEFIIYIGRPDCTDCKEFLPILQEYLDKHENTGLYYVNIKAFRDAATKEDASNEEIEFYESIREMLHFNWTPTLHHIVDGKFVSTYTYLDKAYYEIEDSKKQEEVKEKFKQEFYNWMEDILR